VHWTPIHSFERIADRNHDVQWTIGQMPLIVLSSGQASERNAKPPRIPGAVIREYIKKQEQEDNRLDQMNLWR
jgi:hypothetical protein